MNSNPLVSVIINNYNYGRFLAEAIQSVLDQSYANTEIIVVDDGSTDGSRGIIRSYEKRYPGRIRSILKDNGGQASAMNAGFAASTGDIICFLDSDDFWFGRKIDAIIEPHRSHGFVQHNLLMNGGRYRLLLNTGDLPRFLKEFGLIRSCVPTSAQSFRRDVLEKLFPLPEKEMRLCADVWLRCGALYFTNAYSMDDCLGVYRVHGNNGWQDHVSKERPNIANELVGLLNQHLAKSGLPAIPIRSDSREKSFLHSVPVVAGGRYILFGAGDMGAKLYRRIQDIGGRVICYVDDNPKKQAGQLMGKPILPLRALPAWRPLVDGVVVAGLRVESMYERLTEMGLEYPRDILLPIDLEAHTAAPATAIPSPSKTVSNAKYECPVCMLPVAAWKPFTRRVGENEWREEPGGRLCPYCASFERTRHFWLFLERRGLLKNRPRFLHIAPEAGLSARLRAVLGERYTTTDLTMAHVDQRADLTALPFADCSFDFIYCSNVLEHVPDDCKAMRELFRVLAPGGMAFVQVPTKGAVTQEDLTITDPVRRTELYGQADHLRLYGNDVQDRLTEAGFHVEAGIMPDLLGLSPEEQERMNCAKREMVHCCHKAAPGTRE